MPRRLPRGSQGSNCDNALDVGASVNVTLPNGLAGGVGRSSSVSDLGDVVLMPLMLNYKVSADFNINGRIGFYAPTGSYEVGRLSNTGKNFWTTEPTIAFMYFGQKNGREAAVFVGMDFNSENDATHYQSGSQFHLDGTLAQHLPFKGGLAGVGLSGYYYVHKIGPYDTIWELKWLHETETENRMQGNIGRLKAVVKS
jgi:hypothetical protein